MFFILLSSIFTSENIYVVTNQLMNLIIRCHYVPCVVFLFLIIQTPNVHAVTLVIVASGQVHSPQCALN